MFIRGLILSSPRSLRLCGFKSLRRSKQPDEHVVEGVGAGGDAEAADHEQHREESAGDEAEDEAKQRERIALRPDVVFALDTAMRLAHGFGFLAVREVQAYLTSPEPLDRLVKEGLIASQSFADTTLIRPWPGPPRLLACRVEELPPWRELPGGYRVVTRERLGRELIGAVGPRADLFALYEKAEEAARG